MNLVIFHDNPVHGSAIYIQDKTTVKNSSDHSADGLDIGLFRVKTDQTAITSVYKPIPMPFKWPRDLPTDDLVHLVIGDFNSHSTNRGYINTNKDGELATTQV